MSGSFDANQLSSPDAPAWFLTTDSVASTCALGTSSCIIKQTMEIYPGTTLLRGYLSWSAQKALAGRCVEIGAQPAGFYKPLVRGGAYMSIRMVCLGRHWNATTYRYEDTRSDYDGLSVQDLPEELKDVARRAAAAAGMAIEPDICLINCYPE